MEWAYSQSGRIEYKPEVIDLKTEINNILFLLKDKATTKELNINYINATDKVLIFSDAHMVDTILRNLVSNAIKFTKHNGSVSIKTMPQPNKNAILLSVQDTGVGMPAEFQKDLFVRVNYEESMVIAIIHYQNLYVYKSLIFSSIL